jgi:hypothetical protein
MSQKCPICSIEVNENPRFPRYICNNCESKATDVKGKRVSFGNVDFAGGVDGGYVETNEPYNSDICFVDGKICRVNEGRFGGIYIETLTNLQYELIDSLNELNLENVNIKSLLYEIDNICFDPQLDNEIKDIMNSEFKSDKHIGVQAALLHLVSNLNSNRL